MTARPKPGPQKAAAPAPVAVPSPSSSATAQSAATACMCGQLLAQHWAAHQFVVAGRLDISAVLGGAR